MSSDFFPWQSSQKISRKIPKLGAADDIFISSSVQLFRNLKDLPFPANAAPEQKKAVAELTRAAIKAAFGEWNEYHLPELNELQKLKLADYRLFSVSQFRNLQDKYYWSACDFTRNVLANDENHLTLSGYAGGFSAKLLLNDLLEMEQKLAKLIPFAFHPKFGYLTADPKKAGTGLRISLMLHLPALTLTDEVKPMLRSMKPLGLECRGYFGDENKFPGNLFEISNLSSMGESENEIALRLEKTALHIAERELSKRDELIRDQTVKLKDFIYRSLAVLKQAYLVSVIEAMNALSGVRLGLETGALKHREAAHFEYERLLLDIQPSHVCALCAGESTEEKRAEKRAEY